MTERRHTAIHDLPIASGFSASNAGDGGNLRIEVYCGRCGDHFAPDTYWAERWLAWAQRQMDDGPVRNYMTKKLRAAGLLPALPEDQ